MTLENPYSPSLPWVRGNLHTHTTRSDGQRDPQVVIDDYASRGYDFLMLSDHDQVTVPTEFDARGMVLISGNEVTARGPHILHVNTARRVEPRSDRQAVLDEIAADGDAFAVMAHPNWHGDFNHLPQQQLESLQGYAGIEVYNGVIERLPGGPVATDRWDQLLGRGFRTWGFANDDSHALGDVELGWNVVQAEERCVDGIVDAMRRGAFYGSTGVTLTSIEVCDRTIRSASGRLKKCAGRSTAIFSGGSPMLLARSSTSKSRRTQSSDTLGSRPTGGSVRSLGHNRFSLSPLRFHDIDRLLEREICHIHTFW